MKRLLILALCLLGCQSSSPSPIPEGNGESCHLPPPPPPCEPRPVIEVRFTPNGVATQFIVNSLRRAQSQILVQAYSFTSVPIAEALIEAKVRGLHVKVIVDKSQEHGKGSVVPLLIKNGITVYLDDKHAIAHNKVIIVDNSSVFTGSFNFTNAAEHNNAENLIRIADPATTQTYWENWISHKEHSLILNQ